MLASNLGQIIGRLMYAAAEEGGGAPATGRETVPGRVSRRDQVVALIKARGDVSGREVGAALGINAANATVVLYQLHERGVLARNGTRGKYRYSLP